MERLQNALQRAREKRGGLSGREAAPARSPRAAADDAAVAARWAALKPFVPNPRDLQHSRVVSFFGKQQAGPFDMMRTKVLQQAKAKGWKRLVVTSATPKCGKTTITANLSFSLARQSDLRVMVIELDLRRPSLARVLGLKEPHYFAKVLAGLEPAEQHLACYGGNLAFGTNLAAEANSSELLQSARTREVLTALEETYRPDLTIFDTAPLLASDDTIGFLEHVDAALLIAAAEQTTIDELDVAESEISEMTEVMGVVLNKTRYAPSGYGYEYGYGYGTY
ncbi:CpsD/CapB family tyrosine-protein kinase [Mangrovicoccus algicola]|uniref:CpsD/CapB family tyrosine-protein kinase n=1 Tax=Mangrovicoccus algicola TaxID=2771008 RepID=A0A8J7CZL0_9RHOB|nr:CpsD/CapB family tyrosine-protein kinase [Mangrovicoccus algicola]MBE3638053.1 CpsD/CapB family tyrosine-protein kinase [Mangrovicoccus algicola]